MVEMTGGSASRDVGVIWPEIPEIFMHRDDRTHRMAHRGFRGNAKEFLQQLVKSI